MLRWHDLERPIDEAERVLITTHVRPDGDALGSEIALADLLTQRGKEVEIFNASPTPQRYRFLDPDDQVGFLKNGTGTPPSDPDLLIVVDTGTWGQLAGLANYVRALDAPKVVIDHHVTQDDLGAERFVDATAAACGMLIYQAFGRLGGEITPRAAAALFVAIAMDTGWMRHPNADPEVFRVQGELVERGADPASLYRQLFEANSVARMRLMGVLLERLELAAEGRLAVGKIRQADIHAAGAHPMDTEDFIGLLMSIDGVIAAMLMIEQEDGGTKVSFRSRGGVDCSSLASRFGGGGHRAAAGAMLHEPLDAAHDHLLEAAVAALHQQA